MAPCAGPNALEEESLSDMRFRRRPVLAIAMVGVLALAACQNADGGANGNGGGNTSGSVFISGSSTVEPISAANAEKFGQQAAEPVDIAVEGPGTSDGFALFCAGDSDIQDASRAISAEEVEECANNGIEFIELYVAIDGLSVITSPQNDAVDCLSFTDLWALLGPEAEGFATWSDANDLAEETLDATGGEFGEIHTPYPDEPLQVTAPGEESGTFDSFIEIVLEAVGEALEMEDVTTRPDYQASGDDNVIVQGISGSPSSLGWVGYAFVQENTDLVKALPVDGGEGCVEPTVDTISNGEYPIARPLFIYVNAAVADENPTVAEYVDFYLSDEGRASVSEVGYVDIPDEDWQATVDRWTNRTTGTTFGG